MIKIAFCDDDMEVLHQMNELLDRYRVERNEDITYAAFQSPFELLTEIEKGIRPDILFLDVVMPGQNGMDVAKEIRQYDTNMKIIFLTSSPEFAVMDGNIQNAMNQIGVQISSRFDALFAVLDLMKGYAADDIQPLMERAAARRSVITARSAPEEVSEQEQVIEETVKSIRLAAERNPLLCADKNYTKCMDAVECYGRMVYTSRLIYNDSVTKLNSALGMFPTNVIAGILGFHKREYLSQKGD